MEKVVKTLKISSKGQITLPKAMRDELGTDVVTVAIRNGALMIDPVPSVAGALKMYAKSPPIPFEQEREIAWSEATKKYDRRRTRR